MHLFLLPINNSGSSILYEKIRQSKYTTTLPDEGQFIQGFAGPNPFLFNCPYMFSERYHDFACEKNYDWEKIKELWNSFWEQDLIKVEKSPPNVVRAHMLKRNFDNSQFIIQVRNPYFTKADYEAVFKEYLGITNIIWLGNGIEGDDTHGHIDDLCRFVNENTVVTIVESDKKDNNYKPLQDNLKRLQNAKLENGKPLNIVELPMPKRIYFDGIVLPASYANFLILNKCVLVPTFNDSNDRVALNILADCFPDREIIGISAIDLIWGFGTLHCLSQQIPA